MIDIRPVSDLRNKFSEIEAAVDGGNPVFLTKNGCICVKNYTVCCVVLDDVMEVRRFLCSGRDAERIV